MPSVADATNIVKRRCVRHSCFPQGGLMLRHRSAVQSCVVCLILCTINAMLQPADAMPKWLQAAQLQRRAAVHSRKLLSCMVVPQLTYAPEDQPALPLCTTQYINSGGSGKWVPVTADTKNPAFRATAADLALAWHLDPINPRTDSSTECSGMQDTAKKLCWAGKGVATDATFTSLTCCTTVTVCYIKTGGCVL